MPSMRPHALNPRPPAVPTVPAGRPVPVTVVTTLLPTPTPGTPPGKPSAAPDIDSPAEKAARDGGFHESSYELQNGLQVSESEWPDDVTVPGGLGER